MNNTFSIKNINVLFDYLIVFLIIFYAGKATVFVQAIESWQPIIGLFIPVAAFTAYGFYKNIYFNHRFWLLLIGYTIYFIASTVKFGELHPRFFMINIIYVTMAYVAISGMRFRFFKIYEDFLYVLSIIAIVFWIFLNIAPQTFIDTFSVLEFSNQEDPDSPIAYNFIIYTVNDYKVIEQYILNFGGIQIFRNSGFAWEPGSFAVYVNIAIFANFIRNRFSLSNNKLRLSVFIVALGTTFSTTGYIMLVLLLFFYLYNQDLKTIFWITPIILVAVIYLFTLPFMAEKIADNLDFNTKERVYNSLKHDAKYQPQRFESLQIDFVDFLNHPIIGYGGHQEARWTEQMGAQIATVSGIGKILAQYGLVGTFFFFFSLWQSSKRIISVFNIKGVIFPVLFVVFISISYGLFIALYMCIWLFYLPSFKKSEVIREYFKLTLSKT